MTQDANPLDGTCCPIDILVYVNILSYATIFSVWMLSIRRLRKTWNERKMAKCFMVVLRCSGRIMRSKMAISIQAHFLGCCRLRNGSSDKRSSEEHLVREKCANLTIIKR